MQSQGLGDTKNSGINPRSWIEESPSRKGMRRLAKFGGASLLCAAIAGASVLPVSASQNVPRATNATTAAAKDATIKQNTPDGLLQQSRSSSTPVQQGIDYFGWWNNVFNGESATASLQALAATGATWVSINILQYQTSADSTTIFPTVNTVSDAGLTSIIQQAHALHMNVTLKPMINTLSGVWRGEIGTKFTPDQWSAWFSSYHKFIMHYAALAQSQGVQQFVVGTELKTASTTHAGEWVSLVADIRHVFKGSLTYAASDVYEDDTITWWSSLNYIGVDAYYPLNASQSNNGLSTYLAQLSALSARFHNEPILFTEIGYMSTQGADSQPWNWQLSGPISLETQADAYQATLEAFSSEPWLAGFYWWDWGPGVSNGPDDPGYSPQNKPAEEVLAAWYGGEVSS